VDWRGKSVGIVGCGNVGGHLHRRLLALGVDCRCYDPFLSRADNADLCSLDDVLAADIVCLHTPLTLSGPHPTRHLIGMAQLQQLNSGALLLNAGRGDVIDNQALLSFLQQRQDVQVVLDVWEGEPNINTSLLRLVDLASPHIAGYSFDGKVAGTEMIYQALCTFFGIEATMCADDVVAAELTPLDLSASSDFELMREAVLGAYDIRGDDACMREQLQNLTGNELRKGFDALRKNYPKRREFHCFYTELNTHIEKKAAKQSVGDSRVLHGFRNI
jgi:erythronate-4-phosphate dehydrogenase